MMRLLYIFVLGLAFSLIAGWAGAAQNTTAKDPAPQFDYENVKDQLRVQGQAPVENTSYDFLKEQVTSERWYIVLLCSLSIVSLIVVLSFIRSSGDHSARDVVNASGLNLIIFGTIILVLIVDTHEQLTAAIGVLGAIAGYLFGTLQKKTDQRQPLSPPAPQGTS